LSFKKAAGEPAKLFTAQGTRGGEKKGVVWNSFGAEYLILGGGEKAERRAGTALGKGKKELERWA